MLQNQGLLRRVSFAIASTVVIGLGSCASEPTGVTDEDLTQGDAVEQADDLQVITTFVPITQFTKAVAGDRAEVIQLLPANVGPHDYQAKPSDVQAIADADVLVKNGLEMEFFLDDLIANAGNADLMVIDTSEGVAVLSNEDVEGHGDEHGDDHGDEHGHDHGDEHAAESGDSHAGHVHHGEYNPHIWLDPKRVIQQVETIRDGLIAVDPEGETDYRANAAAYIEQLQALDAEFTERLAPYAGQTFVAFHDFAPYFAESYGLEAEFLVDVPDVNPSPDDVRRVIETVEASSLKTLLTEPQAGDEAFASLSSDLNVKVSAFDPMETGDATATEPEAYFTIMRQNVDVLEAAFSTSVQSWLSPGMPQPLATILPPTWATRPFATVVQPVGVR